MLPLTVLPCLLCPVLPQGGGYQTRAAHPGSGAAIPRWGLHHALRAAAWPPQPEELQRIFKWEAQTGKSGCSLAVTT